MKKHVLMSMCAVALAAEALAGEITVVGRGTVSLPPDKMKMVFQVSATAQDAATSKALFSERTALLAATMSEVGVATNELLTSGLNMSSVREWENGKTVFKGYNFSEWYTFVAKLDRARLEHIYARLVDCGIIEGLNLTFELFDADSARQDAISRAVADARAKAETIARSAGVKLGKVDEIIYGCDGGDLHDRSLMKTRLAAAEGGTVSVGELHEIEITDTVMIKWKTK